MRVWFWRRWLRLRPAVRFVIVLAFIAASQYLWQWILDTAGVRITLGWVLIGIGLSSLAAYAIATRGRFAEFMARRRTRKAAASARAFNDALMGFIEGDDDALTDMNRISAQPRTTQR